MHNIGRWQLSWEVFWGDEALAAVFSGGETSCPKFRGAKIPFYKVFVIIAGGGVQPSKSIIIT